MNVSEKSMATYWRGQDEDWIADAREAAMDLWIDRIRLARQRIKASKVKSALNKRALRRALSKMAGAATGFNIDDLMKMAWGHADGTVMNEKDGWGTQSPYYDAGAGMQNLGNHDIAVTSLGNAMKF